MTDIDRTSHSYLLGMAEVYRDRYRDALERIAALDPREAKERAAQIAKFALQQ